MQDKKPILIYLILLGIVFYAKPVLSQQDYKGSVGVRFGYGVGITGTYNLQNNQNLEFLLRYGYHGLVLNRPGANFQVLYEKHWPIRSSNFTAYVGAGPAIGVGKKFQESLYTYFALGVSPIVGFDYTIQNLKVPIILALDYKPTLNIDFPLNRRYEKVGVDFSYYELSFSVRVGIGRMYRRHR